MKKWAFYLFMFALWPALTSCTGAPKSAAIDETRLVGRPGGAPIDDEGARHGALWYRLLLHDDQMQVRVRLLEPAQQTSFFLPGPWAGRDDFAEDIALGSAMGPQGILPMTIQRSQGRIDVDSGRNAPWVELHYTVRLHSRDDEAWRFRPHLRKETFFAYAPTFLILPSDQISRKMRDIPVEVLVPSQWEVVTTWPGATVMPSQVDPSSRVHGFIVDDVRSLRDAFIAAGHSIEAHQLQLGEQQLTIAFEPDFEARGEELVEPIAGIVRSYVERFGFERSMAVFVRHNANASPQTMRGMGRRGGFVLELPRDPKIDENTLLLIAHEAFHMWNGHELVPEPAHERQTRWFKEGVTHYVALQTLRSLGKVEDRFVREELARAAHNYLRNPVLLGIEAGVIDHVRFPYDQGMLMAMVLDVSIRQTTHSRHTLQDWLEALLVEARSYPRRHYDEDTLRRSLVKFLAGGDPAPLHLWDRHIRRGIALDVPRHFESLGLHWLETDPSEPARLLPLDVPQALHRTLFPGPKNEH
ncbi:MAG: hypothetical protein ACNA8W_11190 [Bradymonadaceae bacterium]